MSSTDVCGCWSTAGSVRKRNCSRNGGKCCQMICLRSDRCYLSKTKQKKKQKHLNKCDLNEIISDLLRYSSISERVTFWLVTKSNILLRSLWLRRPGKVRGRCWHWLSCIMVTQSNNSILIWSKPSWKALKTHRQWYTIVLTVGAFILERIAVQWRSCRWPTSIYMQICRLNPLVAHLNLKREFSKVATWIIDQNLQATNKNYQMIQDRNL